MDTTQSPDYTVYMLYDYLFDDDYMFYNESTQTEMPNRHDAWHVFLIVAHVIIVVLGVTGNSLVIWIAGFKIKKSISTIWYLSLAVSDFLFCSSLIFVVLLHIKSSWIFGSFMCHFGNFFMYRNMYSSTFLLVVISVDRCLVVTFPTWAKNKRTISKALLVVLMVWIISAVVSLPNAIFQVVTSTEKNKINVCSPSSETFFVAHVVYSFTLVFLIPLLIIIIICYVIIFQKLKTNANEKSTNKRLKVMIVLIAAFLICWLPYHVVSLIKILLQQNTLVLRIVYDISVTLGEVSCILNPFLYAFMGKNFKTQCWFCQVFKVPYQFSVVRMCIAESGN